MKKKSRISNAKAKSDNTAPGATKNAESTNPPTKQLQQCLNIFRDFLSPRADHQSVLQEIKGHLFNRDFATAFSKPEYLDVYALRWSSSRALAYCAIFQDLDREAAISQQDPDSSTTQDYRVVCIGGGAGAEVVALASWRSTWSLDPVPAAISAVMIDVADWHSVVEGLAHQVTTAPTISQYASAAIKENNHAMVSSEQFVARFVQQDVLDWPIAETKEIVSPAKLITLMFTLNELYSVSIHKTQQFLAQLTIAVQPGTLLLVVDSPGSYSTVSINGAEKKYPMQWLLNLTLLGPPARAGMVPEEPKWEQIVSDDSRWFRLPPGLTYPIELENMRYQIHLFRRRTD